MFAYLKTFLKTIHRESTDKKDISNRRIPFLSLCILVIFQIINVNVFAVETENQPQYLSQSISKLVENHYFPLIDPQYLSKSTTFFQVELLEAYKIMVDESTQDLEKRINAAEKVIDLLNKDILDYDPNFTYENGLRVVKALCQFVIEHKIKNSNFIQTAVNLFEKLYLTALFEDIALKANICLLSMRNNNIELPQFFTYHTSEFKMHELSDYDRAIIKSAGEKVSKESLYNHIKTIQDLKLSNSSLSYPFFNDQAGKYIYNFLTNLKIDTKMIEYHDSELDTQKRPIRNIVATIPGTIHPEKKIVLTAHYDSVIPPGAEDNGSGVAVLLEIARILKEERIPLEYTVEIVFFDYEEKDLNGSQAYVRHALINKDEIIGVINFDMVGWDGGDGKLELITAKISASFLEEGVLFVSKIAGRENFVYPIIEDIENLVGHGDYSSFWGWGIDLENKEDVDMSRGYYYAINVTAAQKLEKEYPYYHTVEDTIEKLNIDFLRQVTQWAMEVVYGLANPSDF